MSQLTVNVRMEENLKKQVEKIFAEMGMNMSTAFNIFARAVVQRREIPFTISAEDHFYSKENQDEILRRIENLEKKENIVVKTMEELEAMENE